MPHSVNNSTSTQTKMSRPSSTSTYSASNAFPKQAGAQMLAPEAAGEQLSPSPSQFSFASSPQSVQEPEQPARPVTSRSRAQFYEDSFSYKDGIASSARERVIKDAPIVAELRTNVIVRAHPHTPLYTGMLTEARSRMNTPWSPISHIISPQDTSGPRRPL
jgi:hypothetical protein